MEKERNIIIIGGGIIGCTSAYFLTRHIKFNPKLHSITILEAAPNVAAGASGKAGGLLGLWAYPAAIVPLSFKLHAELAAEHDGAQRWGYRKLTCGTIKATIPSSKIDDMKTTQTSDGKTWEKLPKQNSAAKQLLQDAALPDGLDWVDSEVIEAWQEMGSPGATDTAQVHPFHFTTSMAELANEAGVTIKTMSKVTKLNTSRSGVQSIEYLDRETGETHSLTNLTDVLVAAGPWSGRILPKSGVQGLRAHSVVYQADVSPFAVFTDIDLPDNFAPEHRQKQGQGKPHRGAVDPEIYARPFGEVYACGEPDSAVPLPETADEVECDELQCDDMISYISTISPILAAAPVKAKQACYLPQHSRGPLIGRTSIPGLFLASGHTCWGIQNGPATGKLISEYIFDGKAKSANADKLEPKKHGI